MVKKAIQVCEDLGWAPNSKPKFIWVSKIKLKTSYKKNSQHYKCGYLLK